MRDAYQNLQARLGYLGGPTAGVLPHELTAPTAMGKRTVPVKARQATTSTTTSYFTPATTPLLRLLSVIAVTARLPSMQLEPICKGEGEGRERSGQGGGWWAARETGGHTQAQTPQPRANPPVAHLQRCAPTPLRGWLTIGTVRTQAQRGSGTHPRHGEEEALALKGQLVVQIEPLALPRIPARLRQLHGQQVLPRRLAQAVLRLEHAQGVGDLGEQQGGVGLRRRACEDKRVEVPFVVVQLQR